MQLKGWHIQNSLFESCHFHYIIGKTLKTLNKIKEEPCNSQKKYEKGGFGF